MISTYQLKSGFQQILRPIAVSLRSAGCTPNQITLFATASSVGYASYIAVSAASPLSLWLLPGFLLVRMALNAIDGWMARHYDLASPLGLYLNEISDLISDTALFLAFAAHPSVSWVPVVAFSFVSLISETAGQLAAHIQAPRGYQGPMGKSDRCVWIAILAVALASGVTDHGYINAWLYLGSLLGVLTTINRVRAALRQNANSK